MASTVPHATRDSQYDAFGERVAGSEKFADVPQGRFSQVAVRAGVTMFWSLVVGIVAARVVYFDPDLAKTFGALAVNGWHALLNG